MIAPTAASFLNLDLEIEAEFDLTSLAKYFEGRAYILFIGNIENKFRLVLEPIIDGRLNSDPSECTEYFLKLLEKMPKETKILWSKCSSRVFDYGYDGGFESPPIHFELSALSLARLVKLGVDQRVTVYPFR